MGNNSSTMIKMSRSGLGNFPVWGNMNLGCEKPLSDPFPVQLHTNLFIPLFILIFGYHTVERWLPIMYRFYRKITLNGCFSLPIYFCFEYNMYFTNMDSALAANHTVIKFIKQLWCKCFRDCIVYIVCFLF